MFGNSGNQMVHMVQKHQWDKVEKKLSGADAEAKTALASACGESSDEEASVLLLNLLQDSDEKVLLQAVKSLGAVGHDNAKTNLQWLAGNLPADKKEIQKAISEAITKISNKR